MRTNIEILTYQKLEQEFERILKIEKREEEEGKKTTNVRAHKNLLVHLCDSRRLCIETPRNNFYQSVNSHHATSSTILTGRN